MESRWKQLRRKRRGSAKQLFFSRLIRSLRAQLFITQKQLGLYLGVSEYTVKRWSRKDGVFPMDYRWMRIREVWALTKLLKDPKFLADRVEPPDFTN
jgi:DNA-binding XRE family transcriptional regulator